MKVDPKFWAFDDPVDHESADLLVWGAGRDVTFDTEPDEKDEEPASVVFNAIRDRYEPVVDETGEDS